jgi:hypothetical protein
VKGGSTESSKKVIGGFLGGEALVIKALRLEM